MGCMLELLKNERTDYSVFKPLFLPAQTNGTPHDDRLTGSDVKAPMTVKNDILLNGDSGVLQEALHFQMKTVGHSKQHMDDHICHNPTQTHSKKPDSLDLTTVNRDSTGKSVLQSNPKSTYSEHLAEMDQHTFL